MVLIGGATAAQGRVNSETGVGPTAAVERTGGGGGKVALTAVAGFPNGRRSNDPPQNAIDGNTATFTWTTEANNVAIPSHLAIGFASTAVNRLRLWKDDHGGGGQNVKNLTIQYTTGTGPLESRNWRTVSGLTNGFGGAERLRAQAVNANGTVIGDVHDSAGGHGWASLSFTSVNATGLRISFVNPPGGPANPRCSVNAGECNHYRVGELEAYGSATAGGGGGGTGGGGGAAGTLTLVDVTTTNTYSPQNWTIDVANRTMIGSFPWGRGTYRYTMPTVIPPGGAPGKLSMTINATQRWATGFSVSGNVDITPPAAIDESTDKHGLSFSIERSFTIKPRQYPAGTTFVDIIGYAYYNEGPRFTFRYRVGTAAPAPTGALVGSSFDGGTTQPSIDVGRAPEPVVITTETAHTAEARQLIVSVTGNGIVSRVVRALARNAGGAAPISCGLNRFLCYARLEPQQRVTLQARPLPQYRFRAWTGACAGQGPRCTVAATALSTVTAVFVPKNPGAAVALNVLSPNFSVRWVRGVGNGAIVVRGSVSRRSRLVLQVRRPGGGPLLFKYLTASGPFTQTMSLTPGELPPGAKLFPGGFVVSVTGTSGGFQLPLQLRSVVLPAPSEGVVRHAFSSATREGGAQPRFARGTKEVWANFRFATQPLRRMPVTVTWYRPNGSKLGTVKKANRPEVESFMSFAAGLPPGLWTAELRAGGRIAKRLAVRIS